ncbi:MAG: SH3 domain-containing protein, partial [Lachnospiraceae bacterium]|nr:SH3 domain-containing protein [Lachnospiraceae bacterium]
MNKRNELRKRNIELYLKKNIFSGKYIVRNLMAATIAVSSVAGIVGATTVIADSVKDEAGDSIVVAEEDTQKVLGDISYASIPQLSSDSIGVLLADMELNETMDIASRQAELVTYALGEFDTKFVGIADDVNVHSEASTDAEVVGTISKGVVGDIISSDGEWVYISSGDVTGYVNAEYILTGDEAGEYASDYYTVVGTVNDNGVYVRSKASKDSVYVATANNGDRYDVEDLSTIDSEWVCVQVDENVTGYIYSEYIDVEGSYPTAVAKLDLPEATGSISVVKADKPQAT